MAAVRKVGTDFSIIFPVFGRYLLARLGGVLDGVGEVQVDDVVVVVRDVRLAVLFTQLGVAALSRTSHINNKSRNRGGGASINSRTVRDKK